METVISSSLAGGTEGFFNLWVYGFMSQSRFHLQDAANKNSTLPKSRLQDAETSKTDVAGVKFTTAARLKIQV